MIKLPLLLQVLTNCRTFCLDATDADWSLLIQQARAAGLFATLYNQFLAEDLLPQVPLRVQKHLLSGQQYADKQKHSLLTELLTLESVFSDAPYPCVILKGAAYRCAGFNYARGRLFSDIDLLVPKQSLDDASRRLAAFGYVDGEMNDYDRAYYLRWSHQLPPKYNLLTGASLDLHHHIYPVASAEKLNIQPFFEQSALLDGSALRIPPASLMFVHACVHLFYQEESHKLQKDLIDLSMLFREVSSTQPILLQMAQQIGAEKAVSYGLKMLDRIFAIELTAETKAWLATQPGHPRLVICLLETLLQPTSKWHLLAHLGWFLRGHLLKMGPATLSYHLLAKSWFQFKHKKRLAQTQQQRDFEERPADAPVSKK